MDLQLDDWLYYKGFPRLSRLVGRYGVWKYQRKELRQRRRAVLGPVVPQWVYAEQERRWREMQYMLKNLVVALDAGSYDPSPVAGPLVVEDLAPVMECVTFSKKDVQLHGNL